MSLRRILAVTLGLAVGIVLGVLVVGPPVLRWLS